MGLALPASAKKRYLTGADWIMRGLDFASRKETGCAHAFMLVLELDGTVAPDELEEKAVRFCGVFSELKGRVRRDWNLAPFWNYSDSVTGKCCLVESARAYTRADAYKLFDSMLNGPASSNAPLIRFLMVTAPEETYLGCFFEHVLFDARGGELFLQALREFIESGEKTLPPQRLFSPAYLDQWGRQFAAGKRMNRLGREQAGGAPVLRLKKLESGSLKNSFRTLTFDAEAAALLFNQADAECGSMIFLPVLLAKCVGAIHPVFEAAEAVRGRLIIPVTKDMRKAGEGELEDIFFNHLSFLFFDIPANVAADPKSLVRIFKNQFYEQVKEKTYQDLWDASMLTRILPLSCMASVMSSSQNPMTGSFSFSLARENGFQMNTFMGRAIRNLIHVPRVPVVPGAGFFWSRFADKLNVTFSYLDCLVSDTQAEAVMESLGSL